MTQIVFAAPSTPETPPPSLWTGVSSTWQGPDGSLWDLTNPGTSGVVLGKGVRGVGMPSFQTFTSESDARDGARFRGVRTPPRDAHWTLHVYGGKGTDEWLDHDAAFWDTMRPDVDGLWTVRRPNGTARSLTCRLANDGDYSADLLPGRAGWETYAIDLIAYEPYWLGQPIVRAWGAGDAAPFLNPAGSPPLHIAQDATFATATLPNPGDVPAWPVWLVNGPCTSVTVGVGGRLVTYSAGLAAGQVLTIDSRAMTAKVGGTNVSRNLAARDFAPIPAGSEVPLSVAVAGAGVGTVQCTIFPRYLRAW